MNVLRLRPRKRSLVAFVAVTATIATACVKQGPPTVGIEPLTANIVFGVKDASPTPAPFDRPVSDEVAARDIVVSPFDSGFGFNFGNLLSSKRAKRVCPLAGVNAQIDKAAATTVDTTPAPVTPDDKNARWEYKFVKSTTETVPGQGSVPASKFSLPQTLLSRVVSNVTAITRETAPNAIQQSPTGQPPPPSTTFSYSVTEPDLVRADATKVGDATYALPQVTSSFRVRTNANGTTRLAPAQPYDVLYNSGAIPPTTTTGPVPTHVPDENVGESDRGLSLVSWAFKDSAGNTISTFAPEPSVLLFPIASGAPIPNGTSFQSAGVDPSSGASLEIQGQIVNTQVVDVCGQLIQGFFVTTKQTFSHGRANGAVDFTRDYNYVVWTNQGALLAEETYTITGSNGHTYTYDLTLGQKTPDRLPSK